jgi:protein-S-isoprenylcysteine O-methyltransferase Ste14
MSGFPWRRIRHPMYLADLVWLLGFALMAGLPASFPLWLIVVTGVWMQVQTEEKYLLDRFPKEFPEWKTRSGRLMPFPGW